MPQVPKFKKYSYLHMNLLMSRLYYLMIENTVNREYKGLKNRERKGEKRAQLDHGSNSRSNLNK